MRMHLTDKHKTLNIAECVQQLNRLGFKGDSLNAFTTTAFSLSAPASPNLSRDCGANSRSPGRKAKTKNNLKPRYSLAGSTHQAIQGMLDEKGYARMEYDQLR